MLYPEVTERKDKYSFGAYIWELKKYMEFVSREEYIEFMDHLNNVEDESDED